MKDNKNENVKNDITFNYPNGKGCMKYGLISSFIVIICLIGVFFQNTGNINQTPERKLSKINFTTSKLNTYYNSINSCSKNNSSENDMPTNFIFEYISKNISILYNPEKNENHTSTFYNYFKLNLKQFITHLTKIKNLAVRNNTRNDK